MGKQIQAAKGHKVLEEDLRARARRLLGGDRRINDVDRLYLGLRNKAGIGATFREVGDFVAHRDSREKGLLTQVARDVFTSLDVWSSALRGVPVTGADVIRAARANLRIATDEQLRAGCGCGRQAARQRLESALKKAAQGRGLTAAEERALQFLGNHFIWRPAFLAAQLCGEFTDALRRNGIIGREDVEAVEGCSPFIILHAIAVMHGSSILLENGYKARLMAGFANKAGVVEVKMEITFSEMGKPLMSPVSLFLTELLLQAHCDPALLPAEKPILIDHWPWPLEVGPGDKLARVG